MEYETFNYISFDVNWLNLCIKILLKEISSKSSVKKNISKRFVTAYNTGQVDRNLLDIYFVNTESNNDSENV